MSLKKIQELLADNSKLKRIVVDSSLKNRAKRALDYLAQGEGFEGSTGGAIRYEDAIKTLREFLDSEDIEEDFDGTLSDLGPTPISAVAVNDPRGGSRKLNGYAGVPKRHKKRKHRKSEDIDTEVSKLKDTTVELEKTFNKYISKPNTAIKKNEDISDGGVISNDTMIDMSTDNEDVAYDAFLKLPKALKNNIRALYAESGANESFEEFLVSKFEEVDEKDNTFEKVLIEAFKQDDEVEVVKGAEKGFKGTAKSSDLDLKDKDKEFQGKAKQQADIKPKRGDYSGYRVIDDKDKVRKSK